MKPLQSIAFIGNHVPRRCGIATFTHDLRQAIATARPDLDTGVVAMTDPGGAYDYPKVVRVEVRDDVIGDYVKAAELLNAGSFDVACLQHEYGIFGGDAGSNIIELLSRLDMPIVTTLHTVLPNPTPTQFNVMRRIIDASQRMVVMSEKGQEFLRGVHGVPTAKIDIIAHGIPDVPFQEANHVKAKFGFTGKTIILTFGLLSPNKGIEIMLDAMPDIVRSCPNAVYVVLGATHPNLVRYHGEAYRDSLTARVRSLGIDDHVVFFNQFVDQATLLDFIAMCDVYVTPYLNEAQMTSGTLAYSFGLGKAVVSTPYWHAKELLADGRGILVPFGDAPAIGAEIAALLTNDVRRHAMRKRAYAASRSMTWAQTAKRYLVSFEAARQIVLAAKGALADQIVIQPSRSAIPELRLGHLLSMCDSTGLLQHAVHGIPDRAHGYCVDDNARALLLACALGGAGEVRVSDTMTSRFAAFIQHAWNPDNGRFRNFMSYDRRWLEEQGSQDSHGRTLWALGECAAGDTDSSRRRWAAALFRAALPAVAAFSSPRAWAFTLLGLDAYCAHAGADDLTQRTRQILADRLLVMATARKSGFWFEDGLAYDNARLSQALIQTGLTTHTPSYVAAGLTSLRWLMTVQTAPSGCFRPVGSDGFGKPGLVPEIFDQQPLEAAATISACLAAGRAESGTEWPAGAMLAFAWFCGANDLRAPMIDWDTGSCMDGLHCDRPNENKGAESVLSYLLGLAEIRRFSRTTAVDFKKSASGLIRNGELRPIAARTHAGGHRVTIPVLEPTDFASSPRSGPGGGQAIQARD